MCTTTIQAMAFLPHGSEEDIREAAVSREAPSEEAPSEEEAAEDTSECESLTKGKRMPLSFLHYNGKRSIPNDKSTTPIS